MAVTPFQSVKATECLRCSISRSEATQCRSLPLDSLPIAGQPAAQVALTTPTATQEYTNPAMIGTYLSAIVAAKDTGAATSDQAETDAAATLGEIQKLDK